MCRSWRYKLSCFEKDKLGVKDLVFIKHKQNLKVSQILPQYNTGDK